MAPDEWIKDAGYDKGGRMLAEKWGVANTSIWRPLKNKSLPSAEMMVRFHVESDGLVSLADWIKFAKPDLKVLGLKPQRKASDRRH